MEEKKYYDWESVYEALQTEDYREILDTEHESGSYYELPWMIDHFRKKNEPEKVQFLIDLEEKIENEEGRILRIGDKFLLDDENVKCIIEIVDFDDDKSAHIEYSDITYKTDKREISQGFSLYELSRIR